MDADLIVAGAGPVGLAVGVLAASAGLNVLAVDPRAQSDSPDPARPGAAPSARPTAPDTAPDKAPDNAIDKACGEGLLPAGLARLRALGVDPVGHPLAGIRYVLATGGASADARFRAGPGRGVRRTTLQAALAARAAGAGVRTVQGAVTGVAQDEASVRVRLRLPGEAAGPLLRARWLVAADGLRSPVRRAVGLDPAGGRAGSADSGRAGPQPRFGLRRHFALAPWTDLVEVHWARDSEAYVTPVAADLVGVALLSRGRPGSWERAFAGFPRLAERLAGATCGPVLGAGPLRQVARRRVAGRVLLAGDAAGYVDALTGEGVSVGIAQAEALVRALLAGRPEQYERAWWTVTRRYRWLTGGLLNAADQPLLRGLVVPAARRLPPAYSVLVNLLE